MSSEKKPLNYDAVAASDRSTVVAVYEADSVRETEYQSEAQLEEELIRTLQAQAYERLTITQETDLKDNLRVQLERLNNYRFTNGEWQQFFEQSIASANDDIAAKTTRIQQDHIQVLNRENGEIRNISLIDKKNIHNNHVQVVNQYEVAKDEGGAKHANRYDVTILVNGLPLVHIELKRRGVAIREAFNQINRYQRDSFWAGSGLFEYVQLFVISNGTHTKYYSNTTRSQHIKEANGSLKSKKTSNSFEFTSWWADAQNKPITDLIPFAKTFLSKHSLLNILTKYCVLTSDGSLLVMRPYQIAATERILNRIMVSTNAKKLGTTSAGGYIWHTTGSGKTLTSFKTAQLATRAEGVDKVLFVVDRKDLDYQTMKEYDRFEKGAANSNTSTAILQRQLEDPRAKIIITTIQKLSNFVARNKGHEIYSGHVVIIFDECHRSQFGDMQMAIRKAFKNYHLFGFTGTPIMAVNASSGGNVQLKTTQQVFGECLHTYTIVDAIKDKNVLGFRIDYINTVKSKYDGDEQVSGIKRETALLNPQRISDIVKYTLEHFDQKTRRNESYSVKGKRLRGFNALFAVASIPAARAYYNEFRRQQAELLPDQKLKIATIYSFAANPDEEASGILAEEQFETGGLSGDDRAFLDGVIAEYNQTFSTNFSTDGDSFQNYYKDLSQRIKNREVDLTIVVNMFLTGFDATTLNTLFVDKNLRYHGLLQAYSRTNRILNSVKAYGNIVSFRRLEEATNEALALFGNKDAKGIVVLKPYREYLDDHAKIVDELYSKFSPGEQIVGEEAQRDFIRVFGNLVKIENILVSFDEFAEDDPISERDRQDFKSMYLDLYAEFRGQRDGDQESIADDVEFEIELIKQVEINVDYILMLIDKFRKTKGDGEDKELRAKIMRDVDASPSLRPKKDLIEAFVDSVSTSGDIDEEWRDYMNQKREEELEDLIAAENLQPEEARAFVAGAFRDGAVDESGVSITRVLPPMSRFTPNNERGEKKRRVIEKIKLFFERFFGLS